jgi:phosphogluconate dehydratase
MTHTVPAPEQTHTPSFELPSVHAQLLAVTERIAARSQEARGSYEAMVAASAKQGPQRKGMGCANMAHAFAAMPSNDKLMLRQEVAPNVGIITAYNDMLSAHQPYEYAPEIIRQAARDVGATAQVAGGVPAMCDGVTQGTDSMDLSLFSRDVIAMATAVGLSHNVFDATLCLGVCDKIVPGLLIGALQFGHLPTVFVPAGPMTSGLPNDEKAKIRQQFAQGLVGREELLKAEEGAYHGAGTCTFYGTANSNQMLMEIMGLHLPGSSFVNPGTDIRRALTIAATQRAIAMAHDKGTARITLASMVNTKSIVNAIVGLLATGGSTNHTMHLVAMARAAGVLVNWDDFSDLSAIVPSLTKIYPNGTADVNHFHAAGGMGFLMRELLQAGLLHNDVDTIVGHGLHRFACEPWMDNGQLAWRALPSTSADTNVLRGAAAPFAADGGLKVLRGNIGRAVIKTSAVKAEHRVVRAPAVVVHTQKELTDLFAAGLLNKDFVAVVRFQGPQANGMPELHKLTPSLGVLQDKGFKVALVTDGRMSGASGKVPAAIHVSPEALAGGAIGQIENGDMIELDANTGSLRVLVDDATLAQRQHATADLASNAHGSGRDLFGAFRRHASVAELGASAMFEDL